MSLDDSVRKYNRHGVVIISKEPGEGSGTELAAGQTDTAFVSIVTPPLRAKALPHAILAPVLSPPGQGGK